VYAPRRNWDSPNPFLASECSPPPRNRGEGGPWPAGGGLGGVPIPTRGILYTVVLFICTYFVTGRDCLTILIRADSGTKFAAFYIVHRLPHNLNLRINKN
jgi:hypothetical protein